jgi:hypothetical protein
MTPGLVWLSKLPIMRLCRQSAEKAVISLHTGLQVTYRLASEGVAAPVNGNDIPVYASGFLF